MRIIIILISIIFSFNCGVGTPDDETNCDLGRQIAVGLINLNEDRKERGIESDRSRILPILWLISACSSDNKQIEGP